MSVVISSYQSGRPSKVDVATVIEHLRILSSGNTSADPDCRSFKRQRSTSVPRSNDIWAPAKLACCPLSWKHHGVRLCGMPPHHVNPILVLTLASAMATSSAVVGGQVGTTNGEWPTYAGDTGSTRYAPLDQISAANFSKLQVAWRFKTDALGPRPEFKLEATPLMVKGVVYSTAGTRRA